jgi:hypothetical protein
VVVVAIVDDTDGDADFVVLLHAASASTKTATTIEPARCTNRERTCIGGLNGGALGYALPFPAA